MAAAPRDPAASRVGAGRGLSARSGHVAPRSALLCGRPMAQAATAPGAGTARL